MKPIEWQTIELIAAGVVAWIGFVWFVSRIFQACDREIRSDFETVTRRNQK